MKKDLKDMTLEELWELFPIVLTPYQRQWEDWAEDEIDSLSILLADYAPTINHIGSTAIQGIQAKPIVDILVEIAPDTDWGQIRILLENSGYICMSLSETRMSFNKDTLPMDLQKRFSISTFMHTATMTKFISETISGIIPKPPVNMNH